MSESLEQARGIGSDFLGDVHWDTNVKAIFGALDGAANKTFGSAYLDSATGEYRFDATRSGAAASAKMVFRVGTGPTEYMRIVEGAAVMHWTGPRLLIGATAPFYSNADIVYIEKDLGDQLTFTMRNTNGNPATPAGSSYIVIDDLGNTGGINILNSNWPPGNDGVFPTETAFISFGGPCVLGSQTMKKVRFIANNGQWAYFDPSISDLVVDGGNLKVTNGIFLVSNAGAIARIGTVSNPSGGGCFAAGILGAQTLLFDEVGGETKLELYSKSGDDCAHRVIGTGPSGSALFNYHQVRNADGKNGWFTVPETGVGDNFVGKPSFLTIAVDAGYGVRCNAGGANNSGWSISSTGAMTIFGDLGLYGVPTVAQQTVTGSRASGAALDDLLTKLANTGIIIDGTVA